MMRGKIEPTGLTIVKPLKKDIFGRILLARTAKGDPVTIRSWSCVSPFVRPIARFLASRERKILSLLERITDDGIPRLLHYGKDFLVRTYIEGESLKESRIQDPLYYKNALELIEKVHGLGVVHNDLEKPENWLVTENKRPAIVDFQISCFFPKKGALYRLCAKEDRRHLMKQKSRYFAEDLSEEEKKMVTRKSSAARLWDKTFKPVYNLITRKIFHYSDRQHSELSR